MKAFVARGVRAHHAPRSGVALAAAFAGAVLLGTTMLASSASAFPSGFRPPAVVQATVLPRVAPAELLRDQDALRGLVRKEADLSTNLDVVKDGRRTRYIVADLDRAMLNHIAMVQAERDPADASTDALYGLDDAAWSKMMLSHAAPVGLGKAMEGITVAKDGTAESEDPSRVAAMLDLKKNPAAATKVFAHWLATQIHKFDDQIGRPPSPGETSVISLTDAWGGEFASVLNANKQSARLGPEIGIVARSWKQALFTDGTHEGWLSTAMAMARLETSAGKTWTNPDAAIPVREAPARIGDNSWTGRFRGGIGRLKGLVADGAGQIRQAAGESLSHFAETRHDDEAPPTPTP